MSAAESLRICTRCLLGEMAQERPLYQLIQERIALVNEEERVPTPEYARRLSVCKACDSLGQGTCLMCGCYVELRALKKHMSCPAVPEKW